MAGLNSTISPFGIGDPRTPFLSTPTTPTSTSSSTTTSTTTSSSTTSSSTSTSTSTSSSSTSTVVTATVLSTTTPSITPSTVVSVKVTTLTSTVPPVITRTSTRTSSSSSSSTTTSSITSTSSPGLVQPNTNNSSSGGLSARGTIAVAVVVPVVVVALLLLLGIFCWRKRKQRKNNQEERRKEVEEYGYNPNNDPTLPAVGAIGSDSPDMAEESTSGYRGWGNVTNASAFSNRKASTTLSGSAIGMAFSEDGRHRTPNSPPQNPIVDGQSGDPLVEGAAAGVAADAATHQHSNGSGEGPGEGPGVHRGPSNASSTYSAAGHTDNSEDMLSQQNQDYGYGNNYSQYTAYHPGVAGAYGDSQPVIRDVSARRNTKIENPTVYPQQGNSGISQNF